MNVATIIVVLNFTLSGFFKKELLISKCWYYKLSSLSLTIHIIYLDCVNSGVKDHCITPYHFLATINMAFKNFRTFFPYWLLEEVLEEVCSKAFASSGKVHVLQLF